MRHDLEQNGVDPQILPAQEFTEDLRALYGQGPAVPPEVDQRIAALARQRLAAGNLVRRRRQRLVRRLVAAVSIGAAAAVVALVVRSAVLSPSHVEPAGREQHRAAVVRVDPRDIDVNGRVDILDAFALARRVDAGGEHASRSIQAEDINGDGVLDRRDVDAVAMAAVSLERPADNRGAL